MSMRHLILPREVGHIPAKDNGRISLTRPGKLRLQPTVVGMSKFNEACQALKNGRVAGRMVVDFNME
jgi:D-arabinose 1-dehydrogenase-like Zn-dependent alcohol dehydrogenase